MTDLDKVRTEMAQLRETERRLRRAEEALAVQLRHTRWSNRKYDARRTGAPIPLTEYFRRHRFLLETKGIVLPDLERTVARWRRDIEAKVAALRISLSWDATPATNAYAWPTLKRIEVAPIIGPETYAVVLHEVGHVAQPCQPSHQRVVVDKLTSYCVRCEIGAWQWAQREAVDWQRPMHDVLVESVASYRKHGTPAEQTEIDQFCTGLAFRTVQVARVNRGL
jgi:hypothetical protein